MTAWRYFVQTRFGRTPTAVSRSYMRLRSAEPLLCAEILLGDGTWHRDDRLFRERMLGDDYDFIEVDHPQFIEALGDRTITSDESFDRPSAEELARLTGMESSIAAVWKTVPVPPGAETLTADSLAASNDETSPDTAR